MSPEHSPQNQAEHTNKSLVPVVLGLLSLAEVVEGTSEVVMQGTLAAGAVSFGLAAMLGIGAIVTGQKKRP